MLPISDLSVHALYRPSRHSEQGQNSWQACISPFSSTCALECRPTKEWCFVKWVNLLPSASATTVFVKSRASPTWVSSYTACGARGSARAAACPGWGP
eukprot:5173003-Prymnesium_polylepis.1